MQDLLTLRTAAQAEIAMRSKRDGIYKIEITFPVSVDVRDKRFQEIVQQVGLICKDYEEVHPGRVMWTFGCGYKMLINPLALSDDQAIPFDENCLEITCAEREDYDFVCTKCGKPQGDHANCYWPNPPAGDCEFSATSS